MHRVASIAIEASNATTNIGWPDTLAAITNASVINAAINDFPFLMLGSEVSDKLTKSFSFFTLAMAWGGPSMSSVSPE